ncbi:cellulose-binding domain-containing protein [Streptomyces sp. HF10]|uniref:cellulose-binding domain-containing protein n=1 Tax=Streptomyces sp. HF10 TaxID=2692233 RepID=UPI0013198ABC|nr:cellulose-binding domain-containing protein [Streptomyces sp. HF10]QHC32064.1 cellulose-binding protein [Streptomyces sp. HF10]
MPDLPTPQDDAEAALFSESWDAVLSYAALCASGSATAHRLATEAFTLGMREVRAAGRTHVRGAGRRPARLPTIPALLTAVRATAAGWSAAGQGRLLAPGLPQWLTSPEASRLTGSPRAHPPALRALRDLGGTDAALLWLAEVEALPLPAAAHRLGLDPATARTELDRVRALFRERWRRARGDAPEPESAGLAAVLAGGVLGWGGLDYLERRRRSAEARAGTGRAGEAPRGEPEERPGLRRLLRGGGMFATALLLSATALGVSLMAPGGSGADSFTARDDTAATRDDTAAPDDSGTSGHGAATRGGGRGGTRPTVAGSSPTPTPTPRPTPKSEWKSTSGREPTSAPDPAPAAPSASARVPAGQGGRDLGRTRPEPAPDSPPRAFSSLAHGPVGVPVRPAAPPSSSCRVVYDLVSQWSGGFQATVTVTAERALDGWRVDWTFPDGQRIGRIWDATARQHGSRVTATAAAYDRAVPARTAVSFGFTGTWTGADRTPDVFTLNGRRCA